MSYDSLMVFTGTANPKLAQDVVRHLNIHLGRATVGRFSDGEVMVEILENVRGKDVFVLQSTCMPSNDSLIYARQDRRPRSVRVPITAKVVANMLTTVGIDRLLTMDLHSDQIQGFFDISVDNIYGMPILLGDVWTCDYQNLIVVSPDVGGVIRAREMAKRLECDLAIIDKRRPKPNVAKVMNIIGEVKGRTCVIMDDMVDTANTLCEAARALKVEGAQSVVAYCTHPVLSGDAIKRIENSELDKLVVTDTIPLRDDAKACERIQQLSVASLLAETMLRISNEDSVSSLFME
jgi:ribose-phosphate pyrophosphokinase